MKLVQDRNGRAAAEADKEAVVETEAIEAASAAAEIEAEAASAAAVVTKLFPTTQNKITLMLSAAGFFKSSQPLTSKAASSLP